MGFSRQEYWGGLPFPFPGDLLHPGIKPRSPTMQADSSLSEPAGRVLNCCKQNDQLVKWVNGQVIVHWWSVLSCQNFPLFSLTFWHLTHFPSLSHCPPDMPATVSPSTDWIAMVWQGPKENDSAQYYVCLSPELAPSLSARCQTEWLSTWLNVSGVYSVYNTIYVCVYVYIWYASIYKVCIYERYVYT